jgi:mono/diheme cytochrome c family protein
MNHIRILIVIFALPVLAACSFSLAEDITPPPGSEVSPPAEVMPTSVVGSLYPLVPISPADGGAIYGKKCEPCHGVRGLGNGSKANELPNPVTAIGSTQVARQAVPSEWYRVVSEGNLDRFMPPFPSLLDRQRWDVVAYSLSLSMDEEGLAQGEILYVEHCSECHGILGDGMGPVASSLSTEPQSFKDLKLMVSRSLTDLYVSITNGVNTEMLSFGGSLSDDERWSVSEYIRTFSFTQSEVAVTDEEEDPAPDPTQPAITQTEVQESEELDGERVLELGSVIGSVINASGGELPDGLTVTLYGFDQMTEVLTDTAMVDPDGQYQFSDVDMPPGRVFMTTVDFGNVTYGSGIATAHAEGMILELSVLVYETTTGLDSVAIDRLHLFYEPVDDHTMRVVELFLISNRGEKTVVAVEEGTPILNYFLPDDASNLEIQDGEIGERFILTEDGFGDTISIRPGMGEYQVMYTYLMPYSRKLDITHQLPLQVDAIVLLTPDFIKIKGDGIQDTGVRDVEGMQYQMYSGGSLGAGESLRLTVSPKSSGVAAGLFSESSTSLIIGLAALGIALIAGGLWMIRRNRDSNDHEEHHEETYVDRLEGEDADTIMDAIITLDDLYKTGELPQDAYRERRAELKARLKELMGEE